MKILYNTIKPNKAVFIKLFMAIVLIFCSIFALSGCSRSIVGYHVKSLPNKVAYQIGEEIDYSGLVIEAINNDETYSKFHLDRANISPVDTSTAGIKKVVVEKDNLSISFNIYVANVVVNDSDDIKQAFQTANNGDIIYLRAGNYKPKSSNDNSLKDIVINKSLTIVGDGVSKTIFGGNFIVGANYDGTVFTKISNFKDVSFYGIGFELEYTTQNGYIDYNGPYGKTDFNGAIRCFDTQNMSVQNCSFKGYGFGILADNSYGLTVSSCVFKDIKKTAIKSLTDTQNCTIFKNLFIDIASNVIAFENQNQSISAVLQFAISQKGHKGIIICKNLFNRIGLHDKQITYFDEASKLSAQTTTNSIFKYNYINNYYVIVLTSYSTDDLEATGIVLSSNSYSSNPQIIYTGTKGTNALNANGIIILD